MSIIDDFEQRERQENAALRARWFQLVGYVQSAVDNKLGFRTHPQQAKAFAEILAFMRKLEEEHPFPS